MIRNPIDQRMEGEYIVELPKNVNVEGYKNLEKIGLTDTTCERSAVSRFLYRGFKKLNLTDGEASKRTGIAMNGLDTINGKAQSCAIIIPESDGPYDLIDYLLANELAAKNNSKDPGKYLFTARRLLIGVGRLPSYINNN